MTRERLVVIDADGTRAAVDVEVVADGPLFLTARRGPQGSASWYIDKATIVDRRSLDG